MIVKPIMLADETNLFYSSNRIKRIIETLNDELFRISKWLWTKKSPINIDKTIFSFFHNLRKKRKPVAETSITIY